LGELFISTFGDVVGGGVIIGGGVVEGTPAFMLVRVSVPSV